jgi:deazaflavin-dependent oxidoreductase (nitroreductase family)
LIETVGRISGSSIATAVGFVEDEDGTLHVAAGSDSSDWALNLRANPICQVRVGDRVARFDAIEEDEAARGRTVAQLILKYGTPAERLGHGPTFRLVPDR